jgi:hypothetical protein
MRSGNHHSLEEERQAILTRMHATRENYRRLLSDEESDVPGRQHTHVVNTAYKWVPSSGTIRLLAQHPILCAVAVTAVVAIGPRRLVRTVTDGGSKITNLTLRNQANIALLTRVITMVADAVQRSGTRYP